MSVCIDPKLIESVKKIVSEPSSISRDKQLTDLLGNSQAAKEINKLYEKSLTLANQKKSLQKFIDDITGVSAEKKAKLKEQIAARLAKRTETIQDNELLTLAQDIWNKKYKVDIPLEVTARINTLKRESDKLKAIAEKTPDGSPERMEYGFKVVEMSKIVDGVKNPRSDMGFGKTVSSILKETGERFNKSEGVLNNAVEGVRLAKDILTSAVYKSVQASADISYAFRQGFKIMTKNPAVWKQSMIDSFKPFQNITSKAQQEAAMDTFKASLISRKSYQQAVDAKLAIGVIEEFFPTTLAEKIPILGNIFKASNESFTIFSQGARMGMFEDMVKHATQEGAEITPQLLKDLAYVANSISGRGSLGKLEAANQGVNKLLFSGRYISSALDTFFMPFKKSLDPIAKKEAMKSSRNTLATMVGLMGTASLFTEVEFDPRSSKFGKMKMPGSKDRWIDLTAGIGSYITLASRFSGKTKSATTGKVTSLLSGKYGSRNVMNVFVDFLKNKLAPAPSAAVTFMEGTTFDGKKPTIGNTAKDLATPITAGNAYDAFSSDYDDDVIAGFATVLESLGFGQTDYQKFK